MVALLSDHEAVGAPEGAKFYPSHMISMFGLVALGELQINDYSHLRLRTFRVSMTPENIEAFYRRRFPRFKFFLEDEKAADEKKEAPAEDGRLFMQYLRFKDSGWMPSENLADIPSPNAPQDGLLIIVVESNQDLDDESNGKTSPDGSHPDQFSRYLILLNYRKHK